MWCDRQDGCVWPAKHRSRRTRHDVAEATFRCAECKSNNTGRTGQDVPPASSLDSGPWSHFGLPPPFLAPPFLAGAFFVPLLAPPPLAFGFLTGLSRITGHPGCFVPRCAMSWSKTTTKPSTRRFGIWCDQQRNVKQGGVCTTRPHPGRNGRPPFLFTVCWRRSSTLCAI